MNDDAYLRPWNGINPDLTERADAFDVEKVFDAVEKIYDIISEISGQISADTSEKELTDIVDDKIRRAGVLDGLNQEETIVSIVLSGLKMHGCLSNQERGVR